MYEIDASFTMVTMSSHTAQNQYLSRGVEKLKEKIHYRESTPAVNVPGIKRMKACTN